MRIVHWVRDTRRVLVEIGAGHWPRVLLSAGLALVAALSEAAIPVALGVLVTVVAEDDVAGLLAVATLLVVVTLVRVAASVIGRRIAKLVEVAVALDRTETMATHVVEHRGVTDGDLGPGDVVETVDSDAGTIAEGIGVLVTIVVSAVTFVAVGVYLTAQSWELGLTILVTAPLVACVVPVVVGRLERRLAAHRDAAGRVAEMAADAAAGARVIRGAHVEDEFLRRYRDASDRMRQSGVAVANVRALVDVMRVLIPTAGLLALLALALIRLRDGSSSLAEVVALYGLGAYLVVPASAFIGAAQEFAGIFVAHTRERAVLASGRPPRSGRTDLSNEVAPLDAISGASIRPASWSVLTGTDSAELAALAERLAGADATGSASIDGVRFAEFAEQAIRDRSMLLHSDAHVFGGVLRDILAGDRATERDDAVLVAALEAVAAREVLDADGGLGRELSDGARELSGGQRHRVLLAQALVRDPDLLVLVEPTRAVDSVTEQRVIAGLRAARSGRTTVIVSDRPAHLVAADHIQVVIDGRVTLSGSHAELREHQEYVDLFGQESRS